MNVNLKHWAGTLIVAAAAGFVIFGLLRGREALNNFLNRQSLKNLKEEGGPWLKEQNQLSIISEKLKEDSASSPTGTKILTPKPTLIPAPRPTPSRTSTPTPAPVLTPIPTPLPPTFSPTPTPFYIYESTPSPTPSPASTPTPTSTPTPSPTPTSQSGLVVINEIAWMGTLADATDEWIELYNPNSFAVDITGWTIKSFKIKNGVLAADTPDITFPEKIIGAFSYFLLERTSNNTISDIAADLIYSGGLNNPPDSEILELRDNTGQLRDKVGHLTEDGQVSSWYFGYNTSKSTMERINPANPGNQPFNWQTNNGITKNGLDAKGNPINGTPKAKNSPAPY